MAAINEKGSVVGVAAIKAAVFVVVEMEVIVSMIVLVVVVVVVVGFMAASLPGRRGNCEQPTQTLDVMLTITTPKLSIFTYFCRNTTISAVP